MKAGQISEVRLRNFRCFRDRQTALLRPLTLLVGDNSTGKTSFLAAVRAIWDAVYQQTGADFREAPYDLGAFPEIVFRDGTDDDRDHAFALGFSSLHHRCKFDADITFESRSAAPFPSRMSLKTRKAWTTYALEEEKSIIEIGSGDDSWRIELRGEITDIPFGVFAFTSMFIKQPSLKERLKKISGGADVPDSDTIKELSNMLDAFSYLVVRSRPFAGAPDRSSPSRTYNPIRPSPDPKGQYIPTYLADVHFRDKKKWDDLKKSLETFGRMSGLFHEIGVKQFGDGEGAPFQLEIKVGDGEARRKRNLIDVGYGVSQVLPVLTEVLRPDAPPVMLFQQPEVHLHPSAQAALGSLFCSVAAAGRQLVIETHSEYIIDRIRMDIRDRKTSLKPEDVSILFFERDDLDMRIHSLRFDEQGNVLDAPDSYGRFFMGEARRSVGL